MTAASFSTTSWLEPDNIAEDKKLVKEAKNNISNFDALYKKYIDPIYVYCRKRLAEKEDAEDICAEVFLDALNGFSRYKWKNLPFVVWLYRIASNKIAAHYRNTKKELLPLEDDLPLADDSPPYLQTLLERERREKLNELVKLLPEHWQNIITFKHSLDMSNKDIARQLNLTEGAVKMHYQRCLKKLRQLIERSNHGL